MACHGNHVSPGPGGTVVLENASGGVCSMFQLGQGRAVVFDDEELGGLGRRARLRRRPLRGLPERATFFYNAMAWLLPPPDFQYVAGPACSGGTTYCNTTANSTTLAGRMGLAGTTSHADNDLVLVAQDVVPGQFGVFFYGVASTQAPFGDGFLCVEAPVFRLGPPALADRTGLASHAFDTSSPPASAGDGEVEPCRTYYFQFWHDS